MQGPLIDVVILSWNRAEMTLAAVANASAQRGVNATIWVFDQGSSSRDLVRLRRGLRTFRNVKLVLGGANRGVPAGRNRGVAMGEAAIVVCIDNDAEFESDTALKRISQRFSHKANMGALGFRLVDYQSGALDRKSWVYPRSLISRSGRPFLATRYCGAGHALRREAFESAGGYDESLFFYWEELDLANKLIELGYVIQYDPEIVVRHRSSPESRHSWQGDRFYYLVRNAIYLDWKYYASVSRLAQRIGGYILKGLYNRLGSQTIRGVWDGLTMARSWRDRSTLLTSEALQYIWKHELRFRGKILVRLREEVFEKLPVA